MVQFDRPWGCTTANTFPKRTLTKIYTLLLLLQLLLLLLCAPVRAAVCSITAADTGWPHHH
jgi:hypothetical protein